MNDEELKERLERIEKLAANAARDSGEVPLVIYIALLILLARGC